VSLMFGLNPITTVWDLSAVQSSATTETTATVTQTSVLPAPPGPVPTVSVDTAIMPTRALLMDSSLSIGASISINQPALTTAVATAPTSIAPTTTSAQTASSTTTQTGSAATATTATADGSGQASTTAASDTSSTDTKSETTASADKSNGSSARSSQSGGAPRTALGAAEKLLKLAEEQADRRNAREARYKSAIEVIRRAATVADIPLCGPSAPDVCMPAKPGIVSDAASGAPQAAIPATELRRKVAILFGNNEYKGDIPKLDTPIDDVSAIGKVLGDKFGYEVKIVRNATKADIVREFKALTEQTERDESVMVMYAGHGYQLEDSKAGFWIPVDASASDPKTWLSNNDIQRFLNRIDAKQISVVSDSCFSGTLTKEQTLNAPRNAPKPELLSRRAVVTLSSGDEEPVADEGLEGHSIFAYHLLKELQGVKQASPISVTYERIRENVAQTFPQTPQLGGVASAGHMSGANYLFEVK